MSDEDLKVDEQEAQDADDQEELSEEEQEQAKLKEAISVEADDIGTLRKKLTVTVPRELIDDRMQEQFSELKREAQVDGFRRGRAPLRLIQRRFGRDVGDQMTAPLVGNAYMAALEKVDLKDKTIGEPRVWVKVPEHQPGDAGGKKTTLVDKLLEAEKAMDFIHLPAEGPLTYTCEVELRPEFELPKLDGIKLERPTVEISEEMVTAEIDRLRGMRGQYVPVEEGSVQEDDSLVVHLKGTVGDRVLVDEDNHPMHVHDQLVEGVQLEGLKKALVGKSLEDTVSMEATVPDDHEEGDLRGKQAKFDLTIRDIKRLQLPDLDQDFAEAVGADDVDELKRVVRQELEVNREHMARQKMRGDVRDYLMANTELDVPSGLSQRQTDRALARNMIEMYRLGIPQEKIEKEMDTLRTTAAEETVKDLKLFFVMEKISDELEVDVTEEEVNSAIGMIAQRRGRRFDRVRDELAREGGLENLYLQLRDEKIMDRLIEDAEITETAVESPKKK